jgi:hypothetical protein
MMKDDLTTGAWQHNIGCAISITLFFTSDILYKKKLSVCIMVVTRAGAITAAAKAVLTSRENEKRHKSAAKTCEWRKRQSEEQ